MKKNLNLKDEFFDNKCIKCGCLYQGIHSCPMCEVLKNPKYCQMCHVIYPNGKLNKCPFKYLHFKLKIHYWRYFLGMIGIKWKGK